MFNFVNSLRAFYNFFLTQNILELKKYFDRYNALYQSSHNFLCLKLKLLIFSSSELQRNKLELYLCQYNVLI